MINVVINGENKELADNITVQEVIDSLNVKTTMLVIEKNLEILPKDQYSSCHLQEGDKLEIVSFFGGG